MSLEHKIEQAFNEVTAPEQLKWNTLAAIESRRAAVGETETPEVVQAADAAQVADASRAAAPFASRPQGSVLSCHSSHARNVWWKYVLPVAACFVLAAVGIVGIGNMNHGTDAALEASMEAEETPTQQLEQAASGALAPVEQAVAYVGIDVNPSLELALNDQDTVINAEAENADAERVLAELDLAGLPYEQALGTLLASEAMAPYLTGNATVDISVTSDDQTLAQALVAQSDQLLAQYSYGGYCQQVDDATRLAAHEAGMGAGKYCVASELVELDSSYTMEDCAHMSMGQLHDAIDHHHSQTAVVATSGGNPGQGQGYGTPGQGSGHHAETHGGGHH